MTAARRGWNHHLRVSGTSCGMHTVETGRTDANAVRNKLFHSDDGDESDRILRTLRF